MITQINTDGTKNGVMINTDYKHLCLSKVEFYKVSVFICVRKGLI